MDDEFIQLKEVTKVFGKNKVLDEVNFSIAEGKITGIIGASGEGKSTILKLIASFYKPTSGKILYFRRDINKDTTNVKKSFGFSIEDGSFYRDLTVYENLYHFGKLYDVKKDVLKRRVDGIIRFVGLENARDVLVKNLSLGMRKRVDLACAMVNKPTVLILDEPTADLDPLLRSHMLKIIKKVNSHGTTVIFTTQILEEVDSLCDNVAVLYNEKIIENGSLDSVLKKYNAKEMGDVFNKIFSDKGRKTYQESTQQKTTSNLPAHDKKLETSLNSNDFIKELEASNKGEVKKAQPEVKKDNSEEKKENVS